MLCTGAAQRDAAVVTISKEGARRPDLPRPGLIPRQVHTRMFNVFTLQGPSAQCPAHPAD